MVKKAVKLCHIQPSGEEGNEQKANENSRRAINKSVPLTLNIKNHI